MCYKLSHATDITSAGNMWPLGCGLRVSGVKATNEVQIQPLPNAEVKEGWRYVFTPPYAIMPRDNFSCTLLSVGFDILGRLQKECFTSESHSVLLFCEMHCWKFTKCGSVGVVSFCFLL
jgi:hypothetical protein